MHNLAPRRTPIFLNEKENMAPIITASNAKDAPSDELIEDSEPEREERRRKLKAVRKAAESAKSPVLADVPVNKTSRPESASEIDECPMILDDPSPSVVLHIVEDLSASTTTLPSLDAILPPDLPDPSPATLPSANGGGGGAGEDSVVVIEPERALDLAQFAYKAPSGLSIGRAISPISVTSSASSIASIQAQSLSTLATSSKRLQCPLPEAALKKISKCPCCDLAWTTRKSTEAKWEHIARCAKKNAYSAETLQTKLEQQLESSAAADAEAKPKKRKAKAVTEKEEPPKPDTLLERVAHQADPPRRTKKQQVPATVQSIPEAQQLIAEKARNILEEEIVPLAPSIPIPELELQANMPPMTQAFVPSKFGGGARRALLAGDAPLSKPASASVPVSDPPSVNPISIPVSSVKDRPTPTAQDGQANVSATTLDLASTPTTASRKRRNPSPKKRLSLRQIVRQGESLQDSDSDSASSQDNEWEDEGNWGADAVLQWDGEASDGSASSSSVALSKVVGKTKSKAKGKEKAAELVDEIVEKQPRKRRRKKKDAAEEEKAPKMTEEETVEMVERELRAMIEEDEELYLRILRYEPIKFDYLLKRALDRGLPERKLKYRLRIFLDKQCINFYTAEPTGPRRRH